MKRFADYAVVYDITSDNERTRVDHLLQGFGFRIQKSVFECRLDRRAKEELVKGLKEMKIQTGFVKIYRLEYSSKEEVIGKETKQDVDEGNAYVI